MTGSVAIVRAIAELRRDIAAWRKQGFRVALVPTMGALHAGHIALVSEGLRQADRVVVSIFVNPKQFGRNEDFSRYPRHETEDRKKIAHAGAHLLFAPEVDHIYPPNFCTTVTVESLSDCLCGRFRPGHFSGVATVVTKLLLQALPDVALFGEKDYQQLLVVRRLTRDLDIPVRIVGVPTVREADGLALSSRNRYLTAAERATAAVIHRTLRATAMALKSGGGPAAPLLAQAETSLLAAGFTRVDYFELRDGETLGDLTHAAPGARLFVAAWLGKTRLIDNLALAAA